MVRHLLTLCLLVLPISLFGQTISLTDLLNKIQCDEFTCVNDYFTKKGFRYDESRTKITPETKKYSWEAEKPFSSSATGARKMPNMVHFMLFGPGAKSLSFATLNKAHYDTLVAQTLRLNFRPEADQTGSKDKSTYTSLQYPKLRVSLTVSASQNTPYYIVQVFDFSGVPEKPKPVEVTTETISRIIARDCESIRSMASCVVSPRCDFRVQSVSQEDGSLYRVQLLSIGYFYNITLTLDYEIIADSNNELRYALKRVVCN